MTPLTSKVTEKYISAAVLVDFISYHLHVLGSLSLRAVHKKHAGIFLCVSELIFAFTHRLFEIVHVESLLHHEILSERAAKQTFM